jgi:ribA/ribD-fused uncharacterized protein
VPFETIYFYSTRGRHGCFSNFYPVSIIIDNTVWLTSEHYYQAQKFLGHPVHMDAVRQASIPHEAARIGRDPSRPLREDWEQAKVGVMLLAVYTKFSQHDDLKEILLNTGWATLVEHTHRDPYWGDGFDGGGKNMLGKVLMSVRGLLKE